MDLQLILNAHITKEDILNSINLTIIVTLNLNMIQYDIIEAALLSSNHPSLS